VKRAVRRLALWLGAAAIAASCTQMPDSSSGAQERAESKRGAGSAGPEDRPGGGSAGPEDRTGTGSAGPEDRPGTGSAGPEDRTGTTQPPARGRWFRTTCDLPRAQLRRVRRGHYSGRSPDVSVVPARPHFFGGFTVTTHAGPWGYLQQVPLVFYGPGYIRPRGDIALDRRVTLADIAPTLARLLDAKWPATRPGRPLSDVLVPPGNRAGDLRLIVTVVWDGGGWNVLERWPHSWPHLRELMSGGTSITNAAVGTSPSVTPAVHTTIGTGAWPKRHGIVDIPIRAGSEIETAFGDMAPDRLQLQTLGDIYDRATDNGAEVGMVAERSWHLGMLGHGAQIEGADKDIAVMWTEDHELVTNPKLYSLPPYLERVRGLEGAARTIDLEDGRADEMWMGHDLSDPSKLRLSPVWSVHQTKLLKVLMDKERYGSDGVADLLFTNYKDIDRVGHVWNMINEEMRSTISYSDGGLAELTRFLDTHVGRRRWVMVVTADHGQAPDPASVGAWPIAIDAVEQDAARHFDVDAQELFVDERPTGFWLDRGFAERRRITAEALSNFLVRYRMRDNVTDEQRVPRRYRNRMNERLFAAAFPNERLGAIWSCVNGAA
jgi:hypothetical protein